jgi:hypothetical protein
MNMSRIMRTARPPALAAAALALTSCVNVRPPTDAITVNLNINIRQEVVVRLQQDVRELIEQQPREY